MNSNPRPYRPCSECGITTQARHGLCRPCKAAVTPGPLPCLMCDAATLAEDRHCRDCSRYLREAARHTPKHSESLRDGAWALDQHRRVLVWQVAS